MKTESSLPGHSLRPGPQLTSPSAEYSASGPDFRVGHGLATELFLEPRRCRTGIERPGGPFKSGGTTPPSPACGDGDARPWPGRAPGGAAGRVICNLGGVSYSHWKATCHGLVRIDKHAALRVLKGAIGSEPRRTRSVSESARQASTCAGGRRGGRRMLHASGRSLGERRGTPRVPRQGGRPASPTSDARPKKKTGGSTSTNVK